MWEMSILLCCWVGFSPNPTPSTGFFPNGRFGEGVEQSVHGGGNKQDESRWKIFGKMGNTGGMIQEDNSAGHCFVLRDLGRIKKP